jgi:hypothetical protein
MPILLTDAFGDQEPFRERVRRYGPPKAFHYQKLVGMPGPHPGNFTNLRKKLFNTIINL